MILLCIKMNGEAVIQCCAEAKESISLAGRQEATKLLESAKDAASSRDAGSLL